MKKIILSLALFAVTQNIQSQVVPNHHWSIAVNGGSSALGLCITTDLFGNVFTAGVYGSVSDFDPTSAISNLTPNGGQDIFISKTSPTGDFLWAKSIGGSGSEMPSEIVLDAAGNIHITGYFEGTADFDPSGAVFNLISVDDDDAFVAKLSPSGDLIWAKNIGGSSNDKANGIDIDSFDGSVVIIGSVFGTIDLDPGIPVVSVTSEGSTDIFVLKLAANGEYINGKMFGSISADRGNDVVIDATTGDLFMTGHFGGTMDFNPGAGVATVAGSNDIFVLKLNQNLEFIFVKKMGGIAVDEGRNIAIDPNGFIYVNGSFISTCNFDPNGGTTNITSNGGDDVFVMQLSPSGALNWVKTFGSIGTEDFMEMDVNANGTIFITGEMAADMDGNPDALGVFPLTKLGAEDAYIVSLRTDGSFNFATRYGSNSIGAYARGFGISGDESGNVYTTGSISGGTFDFDPSVGLNNIATVSGSDIWFQKLGPGFNDLKETNSSLNFRLFPNPINDKFTISGENLSSSKITILDLAGKIISITFATQNTITLSLTELNSGIYLVRIEQNEIIEIFKISKN